MALNDPHPLDPAQFCAYALAAIDASEGRRKRRRRDTTPDAIGLNLKRAILQRAVAERPAPAAFESWLMTQIAAAPASGPVHAVCLAILEEYRFAAWDEQFRAWLVAGAPSADSHNQSTREARSDRGAETRRQGDTERGRSGGP